jgi:hypothetical protein
MAMNSRKYSAHLLQARNDHLQTTRRSKSCRIEGFHFCWMRAKGVCSTVPVGGCKCESPILY